MHRARIDSLQTKIIRWFESELCMKHNYKIILPLLCSWCDRCTWPPASSAVLPILYPCYISCTQCLDKSFILQVLDQLFEVWKVDYRAMKKEDDLAPRGESRVEQLIMYKSNYVVVGPLKTNMHQLTGLLYPTYVHIVTTNKCSAQHVFIAGKKLKIYTSMAHMHLYVLHLMKSTLPCVALAPYQC